MELVTKQALAYLLPGKSGWGQKCISNKGPKGPEAESPLSTAPWVSWLSGTSGHHVHPFAPLLHDAAEEYSHAHKQITCLSVHP